MKKMIVTTGLALASMVLASPAYADGAPATAQAAAPTPGGALQNELDEMASLIGKLAGSYEGEASESWQR
ncbi:hypothetical protein ACFWEO_32695 [Streptomyces roseolus]|uniref:hypothetical protein n=1 Tax=Streptomyces roseolus TaxID=67358 RepID=UPI0036260C32